MIMMRTLSTVQTTACLKLRATRHNHKEWGQIMHLDTALLHLTAWLLGD